MKWIVLPFKVLWRLVTTILQFTGRLLAAGLGLVCISIGVILLITVITAPIGIALILLGILLIIRSLF
ncbi:MAG TPA: hypothetical protein ENN22_08135 [bacterium]|nr:hypothetical protein [bacterium]